MMHTTDRMSLSNEPIVDPSLPGWLSASRAALDCGSLPVCRGAAAQLLMRQITNDEGKRGHVSSDVKVSRIEYRYSRWLNQTTVLKTQGRPATMTRNLPHSNSTHFRKLECGTQLATSNVTKAYRRLAPRSPHWNAACMLRSTALPGNDNKLHPSQACWGSLLVGWITDYGLHLNGMALPVRNTSKP